MEKCIKLKFYGGSLKFSAGHFTIFSETQRETLHGHNYFLHATITTPLHEPGITFNYSIFREKLTKLCQQIHSRFLLPEESPYLQVEQTDEHYRITFNKKYMLFLLEDVVLMPLKNITIEELSEWFVKQLRQDQDFMDRYRVRKIKIQVFNGPEHSAEITES